MTGTSVPRNQNQPTSKYGRDRASYETKAARLAAAKQALAAAEERWLELEHKREELAKDSQGRDTGS